MKATTKTPAPRRRTTRDRSRAAEELMETYRQLGFVYFGNQAFIDSYLEQHAGEVDYGLERMDPRPRVDLTFSAISVQ